MSNTKHGPLHALAVGTLKRMPKGLVRIAASNYIAGETRQEALAIADRLWREKQLHSTLDVLGEDVTNTADIEAYSREFHHLLDEMAGRESMNISIKLTALGQELDEEDCYRRTAELVAYAHERDTFVRFDMEDADTVDSTLRLYRRMRADGLDNCGIVLQSRLFRTAQDIEELKPLRPNVRLCIGIYKEPPAIALQDKDEMKRHLLELLQVMWDNGQYVALATHEEWVVREAIEMADRMGKPHDELEVQHLLGVPRDSFQQELIAAGIKVRIYVPFGRQWHAYSMRRLENNPDMLKMTAVNVVRQMVGLGGG